MSNTGRAPRVPFFRRIGWMKADAGDRLAARLALFGPSARAFVTMPEPFTPGSLARGRQLLAGNFRMGGVLVVAPESSPWEIADAPPSFLAELHGLAWLDDLAALGTGEARRAMRAWCFEWIARFGRGIGPGWQPALAGRRLTRWISHAIVLLHGIERAQSAAFFAALGHHARFLAARWKSAPAGLPRIEALSGLLQAALALEGMERFARPALSGLVSEARALTRGHGVPSRNPEELLEVFFRLIWAGRALAAADRPVPSELGNAVDEIARILRGLRHRDGSLPGFHGGGPARGRLDQALVASGSRAMPGQTALMGYAHAHAGRLSLVMDAGPAPRGPHAAAGALAFELVHGLDPIILNAGPGHLFGPDAGIRARATAAHSTVEIGGRSWGRFVTRPGRGGADVTIFDPGTMSAQLSQMVTAEGVRLLAVHDGYRAATGLTHMRRLDIAADGSALAGEDTVAAVSEEDRIRLEEALAEAPGAAIPCRALFHLAPGIRAEVDMAGTVVSLLLPDGGLWLLRSDPAVRVGLLTSLYHAPDRLHPRERLAIELRWEVIDHASQISWRFELVEEGHRARRGIDTLAAASQNPQRGP